jgi:transposase-like protein
MPTETYSEALQKRIKDMPAPYNEDIRRQVIEYLRGGGRKAEAAQLFSVCYYTVYLWDRCLRERGRLAPLRPGPKPGASRVGAEALRSYIADHPHQSNRAIGHQFGVSDTTIRVRLKQLGLHHNTAGKIA